MFTEILRLRRECLPSVRELVLKLLHTLALGHAGKKVIQREFHCFRARVSTLICDACEFPAELIGEVKRDGFGCILLAKCSEEFKIRSCDKLNLTMKDGIKEQHTKQM